MSADRGTMPDVTPDEREQAIRALNPRDITANERFLLMRIDEARAEAEDPEAYQYEKFLREHDHAWSRWEVQGAHARTIERCLFCNESREVS